MRKTQQQQLDELNELGAQMAVIAAQIYGVAESLVIAAQTQPTAEIAETIKKLNHCPLAQVELKRVWRKKLEG